MARRGDIVLTSEPGFGGALGIVWGPDPRAAWYRWVEFEWGTTVCWDKTLHVIGRLGEP